MYLELQNVLVSKSLLLLLFQSIVKLELLGQGGRQQTVVQIPVSIQ